jgi:hypothetical protein
LEQLLAQHGIDADEESKSDLERSSSVQTASDKPYLLPTYELAAVEPDPKASLNASDLDGALTKNLQLPNVNINDPSVRKLMEKRQGETPVMSISAFFSGPTTSLLELHPNPQGVFRM